MRYIKARKGNSYLLSTKRRINMRQLIPGVDDFVPDFQAKTSEDEKFRLQSVLEVGRNIMLVFYRGHW
jgi:hypothetical protein